MTLLYMTAVYGYMLYNVRYKLTLKCMFFLIKAFGWNIELSVKLSYVFNIVPYGI